MKTFPQFWRKFSVYTHRCNAQIRNKYMNLEQNTSVRMRMIRASKRYRVWWKTLKGHHTVKSHGTQFRHISSLPSFISVLPSTLGATILVWTPNALGFHYFPQVLPANAQPVLQTRSLPTAYLPIHYLLMVHQIDAK
jgi:hypothetical protein